MRGTHSAGGLPSRARVRLAHGVGSWKAKGGFFLSTWFRGVPGGARGPSLSECLPQTFAPFALGEKNPAALPRQDHRPSRLPPRQLSTPWDPRVSRIWVSEPVARSRLRRKNREACHTGTFPPAATPLARPQHAQSCLLTPFPAANWCLPAGYPRRARPPATPILGAGCRSRRSITRGRPFSTGKPDHARILRAERLRDWRADPGRPDLGGPAQLPRFCNTAPAARWSVTLCHVAFTLDTRLR